MSENEGSRRDMSTLFKDQLIEFDDIRLTKLDSNRVNRNLTSDKEIANRKIIDDTLGEGTILKFDETLQNYV